ncbi:putative polyvalent protein kinase domain-containing protein [Chryseobacterium phocaeense]|uniref:putative polyvalent protein kinase domain-containing protein n=1 Tax=Chryseobacterium phocaeense TaxID=1816690 RepID=UPI0009BB4963|nr:hypothetical protein [Chryseobacterium phocaeense]
MKDELQNIISGKSKIRLGDAIQKVSCYLRTSPGSGETLRTGKQIKSEETALIKQYCNHNNFWIDTIDIGNFVSEGAEQKVYLLNKYKVIKLNDAIYYEKWLDYLNNLLLNNYFFPDTAYQLMGFYELDDILYAVVEQDFIESDEITNLEHVRLFLVSNGFINHRNNDYSHHELGIILEDLHDENVLTFGGNLYFIDTVFYLTEQFYQ